MASQFASLAWKEFRERKWILLAGTTWMVLCVIYAVGYQLVWRTRAPVGSFASTSLLYGLVTSILLAMRTSVGEVTRGTLGFSRALPVSMRRLAWSRLLGGVACIVIPIAVGALLMSLALGTGLVEQAQRRPLVMEIHTSLPDRDSMAPPEAIGFTWTAGAIACAASVELLLILCIIGTRCRAESHVGFIGAVVAFPWMMAQDALRAGAGALQWYHIVFPHSMSICYGYGTQEGATFTDLAMPASVWLPLAGNLVLLAALGTWFAHWYATRPAGVVVSGRRRWWRPRLPALLSRLPLTWPGRTAALIWLDLRQAVPMAVAGLMIAVLLTATQMERLPAEVGGGTRLQAMPAQVAGSLPGAVWFVGALWGMVVGAGIFASELRPSLQHFWRSRPISPSAWFWVKYVCGLVAVLGVLDLVAIVLGYRNAVFAYDQMQRISTSYIVCFPLQHAWLYTVAVAGVCWLRKPVWGVLCAFGVLTFEAAATAAIPGMADYDSVDVYNNLVRDELQGHLNLSQHGYPVVYGAMALLTIGAALLARRGIAGQEQ
ncbi:MAG: hypothetical protein ACF8PG_04610 [Maioricimonas sp. JB045]